jgi:hypothetical protein
MVIASEAAMPAACQYLQIDQTRFESMTRCTTVVAMPMAKYRTQNVDLKIWIPRYVHGCSARTNHRPISAAVRRMQMKTNARATIHPLKIESAAGQFNALLWTEAYASTRVPCPSTSKHKMPMVMIESVMRSICRIQRGVNTHEFQVFRGYDMSGATIHEVQPERTRSVVLDFSDIVVERSSLRRSFVILKNSCRYVGYRYMCSSISVYVVRSEGMVTGACERFWKRKSNEWNVAAVSEPALI